MNNLYFVDEIPDYSSFKINSRKLFFKFLLMIFIYVSTFIFYIFVLNLISLLIVLPVPFTHRCEIIIFDFLLKIN